MESTNRRWRTDRLSATSLLRQAHQRSRGEIAAAVSILEGWSYDHWNARGAINVLRREAQTGHSFFAIDERAIVSSYPGADSLPGLAVTTHPGH